MEGRNNGRIYVAVVARSAGAREHTYAAWLRMQWSGACWVHRMGGDICIASQPQLTRAVVAERDGAAWRSDCDKILHDD